MDPYHVMKKPIWIGLALSAVFAAGVAFFSFREPAVNDPFANLLAVLTLPNFQRDSLIGDVEEYSAPLYFEPIPDVDWGDASVSLSVSFPIDDALYGGLLPRRLQVTCFKVSSQTVFARTTSAMPYTLVPEVLDALQALDPEQKSHIRHCKMQIGPRQPEQYLKVDVPMRERCAAVMRSEFGSDADRKFLPDQGVFTVKNFTAIERDSGTLIGAYCVEREHLAGNLQFHAWFLPN